MPQIWAWSGYSSQSFPNGDSHHQQQVQHHHNNNINSTKDQSPVPSSNNNSPSGNTSESDSESSIKSPTVATLTEYSCMQSHNGPGEAAICSYEEPEDGRGESKTDEGPMVTSATIKSTESQMVKSHKTLINVISPSPSPSPSQLQMPSNLNSNFMSRLTIPYVKLISSKNSKSHMQLDHQSSSKSKTSVSSSLTSETSNDRTNNNVHTSMNKSIGIEEINVNSEAEKKEEEKEVKMSSKHEKHSGKV